MALQLPRRMLTYWLKNNAVQQQDGTNLIFDRMYIAVTSTSIGRSLIEQRGPNFQMPAQSGFGAACQTLERLREAGDKVLASDIVEQVEYAFASQRIRVDSMDSEDITFAGPGDPLLEIDTILEACQDIKNKRHGQGFRLLTSGLVPAAEVDTTIEKLKMANIERTTVHLAADNPAKYEELVAPDNGCGFGDVCTFVAALADAGIEVECTAINRPGLKMRSINKLATSLGAASFKSRSFHP